MKETWETTEAGVRCRELLKSVYVEYPTTDYARRAKLFYLTMLDRLDAIEKYIREKENGA